MTQTQAPGRFWVIRHQDQSQPQVVAKFDTEGETTISDEIAAYDAFQILEVSSRSNLVDQTVDQSVLSEEGRKLLSKVYPIR